MQRDECESPSEMATTARCHGKPIHMQIYKIVLTLIAAGKVANPVMVKTFLPVDLDIAGLMLGYLARLAAEATTIIKALDYGRLNCKLSARRTLISAAENAISPAFNAPPDTDQAAIAGDLIDECDAIATVRSPTNALRISIGRAADEALDCMSLLPTFVGSLGSQFGPIKLKRLLSREAFLCRRPVAAVPPRRPSSCALPQRRRTLIFPPLASGDEAWL
jgi:hypothetical protein